MNIKQTLALVCALTNILSAAVTINEFHYDNTGSDINEFIEIVITDPLVTSPSNVDVYFYNGGDGKTYKDFNLGDVDVVSHGILADNYAYFSRLIPGMQNGPDGIAVTHNGIVSEFISYEGSFTATTGPATGMISTNIQVSEASSTLVDSSLQRQCLGDTWVLTEGYNTLGQINEGCSVPVPGSCLLTFLGLGLIRASKKHLR